MKSILNKIFLQSISLVFLTNGFILAQPIQLIPQTKGLPQTSPSFVTPEVTKSFWESTPSSLIETYFPKLPLKLTSPILQTLRAKILTEKYSPLLQNQTYAQTVFSFLMQSGQFSEAQEFLLETNIIEKDHLSLDLQWLQGESKKACEKVTSLLRTSPQAELKKQNVYCLYLSGETERAKIAAELLSESSSETSLLLDALFDSSIHPSFEDPITQSPFLLAVWCTLGKEIAEENLNKLNAAYLTVIARSEKMPHKTRLLAAEKAFQQGLKGDYISDLLKDTTGEELLDKLSQAFKSPKTDLLLSLFERAQKEGKLTIVGEIFKSSLSKIDPSAETLPLAPSIIRALLPTNQKDVVQKWATFLLRESPEEGIALLPHLHLAFPEIKWDDSRLKAWQAYQSRIDARKASENSYALRHILEILGEPQGPALKGEPSTPSWRQERTLFDGTTLDLLDSAANSKRKGEVLLLVLTLFGETPLKEFSINKFIRLLGILQKSGYDAEARSLAVEFLLAKGI
ncbi:MAG: hypothetical protein JSR85_02560 [Proteobacteria bacterium]|nr:hypothetical protein [Pseudomonadota bacterium]